MDKVDWRAAFRAKKEANTFRITIDPISEKTWYIHPKTLSVIRNNNLWANHWLVRGETYFFSFVWKGIRFPKDILFFYVPGFKPTIIPQMGPIPEGGKLIAVRIPEWVPDPISMYTENLEYRYVFNCTNSSF